LYIDSFITTPAKFASRKCLPHISQLTDTYETWFISRDRGAALANAGVASASSREKTRDRLMHDGRGIDRRTGCDAAMRAAVYDWKLSEKQ